MHEDLDVTNNSMKPIRFQLEIAVRCDFADLFEVKSGNIVRRGRITTEWREARQQLHTTYSNGDFSRAVTISAHRSPKKAVYANGRLSFEVALEPGEAWHTCLFYTLKESTQYLAPPRNCTKHHPASRHAETVAEWLQTVAKIQTRNEEFYRLFRRALEDTAALHLPISGTDHIVFMPAAGLPWFIAPFGRDSLIVSLQNLLIYPEFARGSLDILGSLQAKTDDPCTRLGARPATRPCLSDILRPLRAVYLGSNYGDRDGDGFQEYQTRSPVGYENMAWKDSGDCVVYPDGSLVKGPKALCELQGYVYDAWLRTAEVFDELGKYDRADCVQRRPPCLTGSTPHFGMTNWAFMHMRSMATRRRS
jgi:glycogen debranching enzyme